MLALGLRALLLRLQRERRVDALHGQVVVGLLLRPLLGNLLAPLLQPLIRRVLSILL